MDQYTTLFELKGECPDPFEAAKDVSENLKGDLTVVEDLQTGELRWSL